VSLEEDKEKEEKQRVSNLLKGDRDSKKRGDDELTSTQIFLNPLFSSFHPPKARRAGTTKT